MNKKIIAISILALTAAIAIPAFAQTTGNTPTTSTGTSDVASKIACVGTAVKVREQALDTAMTTYTGAANSAYAARATALNAAYANTTVSAVKSAVKTAWSTFNSSMKSARKAWQSSRNSAWSTFRTAAAACKAPAGTGDGGNSGLEASGN